MAEKLDLDALKPCPFCGAAPLLQEHPAHAHSLAVEGFQMPDHPGSWTLECAACECGMIHATKDGLLAAWNHRAGQPGSGEADERAAFENWYSENGKYPNSVRRGPNAGYQLAQAHSAWDVWQARAALAPQPPAAGDTWLPIETAPKDGEIWAFNGEQARMVWSEGPEWALWVWADLLLDDADPSPDQPTHWLPLPAAPVAGRREG